MKIKKSKFKWLLLAVVLILSICFLSCAHPRPPKPGPNFVWIEAHKTPQGQIVPGHWQRVGAPQKDKTWVPGHHGPKGQWIPGHWQ